MSVLFTRGLSSCIIFYTTLFPNVTGFILKLQFIFYGACSHIERFYSDGEPLLFRHTSVFDCSCATWISIHLLISGYSRICQTVRPHYSNKQLNNGVQRSCVWFFREQTMKSSESPQIYKLFHCRGRSALSNEIRSLTGQVSYRRSLFKLLVLGSVHH